MKCTRVAAAFASLLALAGLQVGAAHAQPDEGTRVWRIQIGLVTWDSSNADTDNSVHVSLAPGNLTYLDHARDDFARGDNHTYDLKLDDVADLGDITRLRIRKLGNDGWRIRRVTLLVNGRTIFRRDFDPGHWLDNANGHSRTLRFGSRTLRASDAWQGWTDPTTVPLRISRGSIEHIVEGIVGDLLHEQPDAYWGNRHGDRFVTASRLNATDLRFDVDLAVDAETICPFSDPDLDVDFDLRFTCDDGVVTIAPRNVSATVDCIWIADPDLSGDLPTITFRVDDAFCPVITIEDDGDVVFSLPF